MADTTRSLAAALLWAWRKRHDYSQVEAARLLDIDQKRVSEFERGARKPGRASAVRIQEVTEGEVKIEDWDQQEHATTRRDARRGAAA